MTFVRRNTRELAWIAAQIVMAAFSLWMATVQPDSDKALDIWIGAICYTLFVSMGGYWVWAIFDNYEQDAFEQHIRDMLVMTCYPSQSLGYGRSRYVPETPAEGPFFNAEEIRRRLNGGDST